MPAAAQEVQQEVGTDAACLEVPWDGRTQGQSEGHYP